VGRVRAILRELAQLVRDRKTANMLTPARCRVVTGIVRRRKIAEIVNPRAVPMNESLFFRVTFVTVTTKSDGFLEI
jgi:hypothetical protein